MSFKETEGKMIVDSMIQTIHEHAAYLSEVDGAIGDGDHGINMNKGFTLCEKAFAQRPADDVPGLREALKTLGVILMTEIGGSMGPLYGSLFRGMATSVPAGGEVTAEVYAQMLRNGLNKVKMIGNAQIGDKTLIDTLEPAVCAFEKSVVEGKDFQQALAAMSSAAEEGKESTRDMVAKVGRAARLGERSRGVLDAGAISCNMLLKAMSDAVITLL
jgi:phosphoenolpyruvate---glycerone phosphotransferase subunit DhaL